MQIPSEEFGGYLKTQHKLCDLQSWKMRRLPPETYVTTLISNIDLLDVSALPVSPDRIKIVVLPKILARRKNCEVTTRHLWRNDAGKLCKIAYC